ncbi:MAG: glycosyltransferase family 2 protein [Acidobacteria bacterium]|nr:MAG: glycosyltransferase family 2 protein [Acidobacteriota bacterium]PYR76105.1 MAG: glycosyltransferase family 2 protein [Acidobacteriota bacterium]
MTPSAPRISVCICTYKRPRLLERLLDALREQETGGRFDYSIVVADNDALESAAPVVRGFAAASGIPTVYCVEPRRNIALTRNKAIQQATGDFIAFIDDDEFPTRTWLKTLFDACGEFAADGVLGPVKPHYEEPPPRWVVRGGFYDRPGYPTGFVIDWRKGRTGNVLLKRDVLIALDPPFRPEFLTGEDQDFFRRAIERGHAFVWCAEAVAYEAVPPLRWNRRFMLRRALLRGTISLLHPTVGARHVVRSFVAVPAYLAALPFALCAGQGAFMTCLVKLCDHTGRLLATCGIKPIDEAYVTE